MVHDAVNRVQRVGPYASSADTANRDTFVYPASNSTCLRPAWPMDGMPGSQLAVVYLGGAWLQQPECICIIRIGII